MSINHVKHPIIGDGCRAVHVMPTKQKYKPSEMDDLCSMCGKMEAAIFQIDGNFCLGCWQQRTEPML